MDIDEEVVDITKQIYQAYGSDSGILFGIPSHLRREVEAVIKLTLNHPRVSIKEKD